MLFVGKSERIGYSGISRHSFVFAPPTILLQPVNLVINEKSIDVKSRLSAGGPYGDESRSN